MQVVLRSLVPITVWRLSGPGGVAWNVDKEKFFKKNAIIQNLRIRITTGITGNQNFAAHLAQPIFQYNVQNDYRLQLGAALQGYANPDLKWQQTLKTTLGLQLDCSMED